MVKQRQHASRPTQGNALLMLLIITLLLTLANGQDTHKPATPADANKDNRRNGDDSVPQDFSAVDSYDKDRDRFLRSREQQGDTKNRADTIRQDAAHRKLPGAADLTPQQMSALSGIVFFLIVICILMWCCGCSLMDLLVLFCCWEICCDGP